MGQKGLMCWYRIQHYNTWDHVAPLGPVSSAVLLPLTMTTPPDCSAVHMLIMGAMPMVVPWKYTPLQEGKKGKAESQNQHSVPRYRPYYFQSCVSASLKQRSCFKCVSSRHLQVENNEKHRLVMPTCQTDNDSNPALRKIYLITILWIYFCNKTPSSFLFLLIDVGNRNANRKILSLAQGRLILMQAYVLLVAIQNIEFNHSKQSIKTYNKILCDSLEWLTLFPHR